MEITPEQALYGSSVDIQLQDGTLVEVLTPPFAGDGWRLRIEGAAIGCRDHYVQLKVQTDEGLRIDGFPLLFKAFVNSRFDFIEFLNTKKQCVPLLFDLVFASTCLKARLAV